MNRQKSFDNMVLIFDNLCKLSSKDTTFSDLNPYSLKSKVISLELILRILDSKNNIFSHNVKIIYLLKECLCDALLKNSLCQEKQVNNIYFPYIYEHNNNFPLKFPHQVISLSFSIFILLVHNFRAHLSLEIATFIEAVFLKILESFNSSFNHIIFSLQVIQKILQRP